MFDFDSFREIASTIRKNKMRTALTGFAVAWGIFMLIILLGAGNGLRNGILDNFSSRATNAARIWPGNMSMPYKGNPRGKRIRFDNRDLNMLRAQMPEIEYLSAGGGSEYNVSYGNEYANMQINYMTPDGAKINNITIEEGNGRFINELDMKFKRKVIVLHSKQVKTLFKEENPLGKYVVSNNVVYQVIGVYDLKDRFDSDPPAYIPLSAAGFTYNPKWGFWMIEFTVKGLNTIQDNDEFEQRLREKMGKFHGFDPNDRSALYIWSSSKEYLEIQNVLAILGIFIVIVGLASLMAGIVGVGNIMLITVKERTREIGIRKAIGASPTSVLWLVVFEAIFITTAAGYIGILLGIGVTEFVGSLMAGQSTEGGASIFLDPTVNLGTVIWATILLIVCGVIAGLIPALKAARVMPIEAMRTE